MEIHLLACGKISTTINSRSDAQTNIFQIWMVKDMLTAFIQLMERMDLRKEGQFLKSLFWKNEWVEK
ncbi:MULTISPECIES: hypothetical protein [unclassified Chryseobacterium]|uniref:hypothetical protein n=1 Tax=unclassified Chryseobacterium TaxID=2593645 RepID=UPI0028533115|nr:hypothetical protein [Chryseobacterium sp. CFS7]MDR4892188.1 hypothetical protein [Chryseobacterium sp. CFS7]